MKAEPTPGGVAILPPMIESYKREALTRLRTVEGHLRAVVSMVEDERYCPELMKQVAALQASLERVNRLLLRNHLETCVTEAIQTGQGREKIDELIDALRFNSSLTDFRHLAHLPESGTPRPDGETEDAS